MKLFRILIVCLLWSLSACGSPPTATVPPTPHLVSLQLTTAVMGWRNALASCAAAQPQVGLVINEAPLGKNDLSKADALLRFGEPLSLASNSAILGWDEVVVIIHPSNPATQITRQALLAIYAGKDITWGELELPGMPASEGSNLSLQVWAYPPGDDVRQVFDQVILNGTNPSSHTYVAPDAAAMLEAVAKSPGSIGYILESDLASGQQVTGQVGKTPTAKTAVKQLEVADDLPGFKQPILAISSGEPQGDLRQLLACLQKK